MQGFTFASVWFKLGETQLIAVSCTCWITNMVRASKSDFHKNSIWTEHFTSQIILLRTLELWSRIPLHSISYEKISALKLLTPLTTTLQGPSLGFPLTDVTCPFSTLPAPDKFLSPLLWKQSSSPPAPTYKFVISTHNSQIIKVNLKFSFM